MERTARAEWSGGLKAGKGTLGSGSGVLEKTPYSFATRFENQRGTNPEELVGAAHAGCFTMALAAGLEKAGHTPERLVTEARVQLEKIGEGWEVPRIRLSLRGKVPGITRERFLELADEAKAGCPISKLLRAEIQLEAVLE